MIQELTLPSISRLSIHCDKGLTLEKSEVSQNSLWWLNYTLSTIQVDKTKRDGNHIVHVSVQHVHWNMNKIRIKLMSINLPHWNLSVMSQ